VRRDGNKPNNTGVFDVLRFGAASDGKALCTTALQGAIDACAAGGGGLVVVPPGRYLSGALFLRNNVHLHLSQGATLVGSPHFDDYPPIRNRWEGVERQTHASLLTGIDLQNVTISGEGIIDGQGMAWWDASSKTREIRVARKLPREAEHPPDAPLRWPCPRLINLIRCQRVLLDGLKLMDSPSVSVHLLYCQDVMVRGVRVGIFQALGVDGIIIDSSQRIRVMQCLLECGDCVAVKSGYNEDGRRVGIPSEDILVSNCNMMAGSGSGLAIGSETAGGVRNVSFTNSTVTRSRHGVSIRSPRGRGGGVERVRVSNVLFDDLIERAVRITNYYDSIQGEGMWAKPKDPAYSKERSYYPVTPGSPETDRTLRFPVDEGTPFFRDFEFSGLSVGTAEGVAYLEGLPERFITGVRLRDVVAPQVKSGVFCARINGLSIDHLVLGKPERPAVDAHQVQDLELHRLRCAEAPAKSPLVRLDGVLGALVHGCDVPVTGPRFVELQGPDNRNVTVDSNSVTAPASGS
jgi:hypothetical protein